MQIPCGACVPGCLNSLNLSAPSVEQPNRSAPALSVHARQGGINSDPSRGFVSTAQVNQHQQASSGRMSTYHAALARAVIFAAAAQLRPRIRVVVTCRCRGREMRIGRFAPPRHGRVFSKPRMLLKDT